MSQGESTTDIIALQMPLCSCSELVLLHSPWHPGQKRCVNNILCKQCSVEKGKAPYPCSHRKPVGSRNWSSFPGCLKACTLHPKASQPIWIDVMLAVQSWTGWDLPAGTYCTHTCNKPDNFWGKLNLFPLALQFCSGRGEQQYTAILQHWE